MERLVRELIILEDRRLAVARIHREYMIKQLDNANRFIAAMNDVLLIVDKQTGVFPVLASY